MTELEKDVERKLREMIESHGGLCLKWVCPGWAGVPDRICLLPGGRIYFVELKRPKGGKTAKLQEWWHSRLRRLGFFAMFVCSRDDVRTFEQVLTLEEGGL